MAIAGYLKSEHRTGTPARSPTGHSQATSPVPEAPQIPPQDRQPGHYCERPAHMAA
jgi:hypothetical protein